MCSQFNALARIDWMSAQRMNWIVANRARPRSPQRDDLSAGGRIAIIDFRPDSPTGPPTNARIPADRVKDELKRAGYALMQEHTFLPNQYFLVFERAG